MILSDREIRAALARDSIRITPDPREQPEAWTSTALDLRLHDTLAYWNFPPGSDATPEMGYSGRFAVQGPKT